MWRSRTTKLSGVVVPTGAGPREAPGTTAVPEGPEEIRAGTVATAGPARRRVHPWRRAPGATAERQKPERSSRRRRHPSHPWLLESTERTRSSAGRPGRAVPPSAPAEAIRATSGSPAPAMPTSPASARRVTVRPRARTPRTVLTQQLGRQVRQRIRNTTVRRRPDAGESVGVPDDRVAAGCAGRTTAHES